MCKKHDHYHVVQGYVDTEGHTVEAYRRKKDAREHLKRIVRLDRMDDIEWRGHLSYGRLLSGHGFAKEFITVRKCTLASCRPK